MSTPNGERYFVAQLDEGCYKPTPEAEFEVQILEDGEPSDWCAYIGRDSNAVIAFVEFASGGPKLLPPDQHGLPIAVIEAARQRRAGFGEYVNENGEIVRPSFLPPMNR